MIDIGTTSGLLLSFGAAPSVGDKYFLILNDSTEVINGLFAGIADGAEFTARGYIFSADYGADSKPPPSRPSPTSPATTTPAPPPPSPNASASSPIVRR